MVEKLIESEPSKLRLGMLRRERLEWGVDNDFIWTMNFYVNLPPSQEKKTHTKNPSLVHPFTWTLRRGPH